MSNLIRGLAIAIAVLASSTAVLAGDRPTNPLTLPPVRRPANPPGADGVAPGAMAAQTIVLTRREIFDPTLQMNAASLLVPDGWKVEGKISWIPAGQGLSASDIVISDPNSHAVARFYPQIAYIDGERESQLRADVTGGQMRDSINKIYAEGNFDDNGVEIRRLPNSVQQYLKEFLIPRYRPELARAADLKIVEDKPMPEYADHYVKQRALLNTRALSSRIRFTYSSNGENTEEVIFCTLIRSAVGLPTPELFPWSAEVHSYSAPAGKLDALLPLLTTVHDSVTPDLGWYNRYLQIAEMIMQMQREKLQAMLDNGRILMDNVHRLASQTQAEVSDHIRDNYEKQQKDKAGMQEQFMQYVNDLQPMTNPTTGAKMLVPAGYSNGFIGSNGSLVLTNNPSYQPGQGQAAGTGNTTWQALKK